MKYIIIKQTVHETADTIIPVSPIFDSIIDADVFLTDLHNTIYSESKWMDIKLIHNDYLYIKFKVGITYYRILSIS